MTYMKDTLIRPRHTESTMRSKVEKMMHEISADNKDKDLQSKLQKVGNANTIKENIEKVLEFDKECEQNGYKIAYRYSTLTVLHYLCQFAGSRRFMELTKSDIIQFLEAAKNRRFKDTRYRARANPKNVEKQLSESTMNLIKLHVRRFFQWLYGMEKGQYPESVRWIQVKTIKGERELTPEDLPTAQEVKQMIECTENPRNRALISLLAESGARCGEVSTLLLKDISWTERGFILTIRGNKSKSQFGRQIPLCACAEDVKNYINNFHPFKGDKESPLFVSFVNRTTPKTNLKIDGMGMIVRKAAKRAGVEERIHVHPHLFRHLRASQLAELGWNEPTLRQFFGWSKISRMPATYIHMSQRSLNERYYQMYGKPGSEQERPQVLEGPRICPNCGTQNPTGYRFCFRCNTALNQEEQKRIENDKEIKSMLNFIAKDNELSKKFLLLVQEAVERQKFSLVNTGS